MTPRPVAGTGGGGQCPEWGDCRRSRRGGEPRFNVGDIQSRVLKRRCLRLRDEDLRGEVPRRHEARVQRWASRSSVEGRLWGTIVGRCARARGVGPRGVQGGSQWAGLPPSLQREEMVSHGQQALGVF